MIWGLGLYMAVSIAATVAIAFVDESDPPAGLSWRERVIAGALWPLFLWFAIKDLVFGQADDDEEDRT